MVESILLYICNLMSPHYNQSLSILFKSLSFFSISILARLHVVEYIARLLCSRVYSGYSLHCSHEIEHCLIVLFKEWVGCSYCMYVFYWCKKVCILTHLIIVCSFGELGAIS